MKSLFIFFALILLLAPSGMNVAVGTSKAGAQGEITEEDMTERWKHLTIRRDPFLDPEWLKKKQEEEQKRKEEEERRKAEERRRREKERKKQALKLKGILQVGKNFIAIIDGKTVRAGDVIRGRKILEVSRSGIKILHGRKVRTILWEPKTTRRLR
jgi:Tfp pilus assembly protein PilP